MYSSLSPAEKRVADAVGVDPSTINKYARGARVPTSRVSGRGSGKGGGGSGVGKGEAGKKSGEIERGKEGGNDEEAAK